MSKRARQPLDKVQLTDLYHRMIQVLQEAQFYKRAIDQSAAIAFLDPSGKITDINENYTKMFRITSDEVIGQKYFLFNKNSMDELTNKHFYKTLKSGKNWKHEHQYQSLWLEVSLIPLTDGEGNLLQYMLIQNDITAKKQAESDLEQERLRSFHAAKMASLGEMAGGVAHEINNPLAVILGKSDQLKRMVKSKSMDMDKIIENIEKIESTAVRISKIVKGLRTLSRAGDQDPFVPFSFRSILDDVQIISKERFTQNEIDLRVKNAVNVLIECRGVQVAQVLLNLISNAFDAVQTMKEKWVEIDSKDLGDNIEIYVTDSGKGIPPDFAQKIMEPFYTTKDVGKGTGLGLSISKSIIESHGGRFYYDAQYPNTRFVLSLPKRQLKQAA